MRSEKVLMKHLRPSLFKRALPRQSDAWAELRMEQSMLSAELADRGLRSDKNRRLIHSYYCVKTKSVMPFKVFWGKYIYVSDIMVK